MGGTPIEIKIFSRESRAGKGFLTGFTLIELLVVIAIIALLMAILMPALKKAKDQAKAVACLSTLHQWGPVWFMYTQDNNGFFCGFATAPATVGVGEHWWPVALKKYYMEDDPSSVPCGHEVLE